MLHLDGFASLASNYDGGRVTIRPFALNGNELWVNAKADSISEAVPIPVKWLQI